MSNSIITILNLACIKHTGCPLPSSLLGTDWKYIEDDCFQPRPTCPQRKRFAVWDPSPYSYPLKEVMPTDDPEHKILRNIVVDELKEIFNFEKTMLKAKTYLVGFRVFASLFVEYDCSQKIVNVLRGDEGLDALLAVKAISERNIFEKIGHEELCEIRKVFTQNLDDLTGCFIKEKNFKKTFEFMFDINNYTADFFIDEYGLKERLRGNQPLTDDDFEEIIKLLGQSSFCGVSNFDEYLITSIIKALIKYGFDIPSGLKDYRIGYTWNKFFKRRSVRKIEKKIRLSIWTIKQRQEYLSRFGMIKKNPKAYNAFYDCAINTHGWWGNRMYVSNLYGDNLSPFRWDSWRFSTSRGKRAFDWLKLNSVQRPLYTEELVRIYAPNKVQDRKKIEDKVKNNFSANPPQPIYHRLN